MSISTESTTRTARTEAELQAMARDHGHSYVRFVLAQSLAHRSTIRELPFSEEAAERFARLADASVAEQRRIETTDAMPFEAFRQSYLAALRA